MTSMTGYSYVEQNFENATVSVELKSVNSRFLDLSINLPPFLNPLESFFRSVFCKASENGTIGNPEEKSVFVSEISLKLAINFRACFEKYLLGNTFNNEIRIRWTFGC